MLNYPMNFFQSTFLSLFLGLRISRDTKESFDKFDHFINIEIKTEDKEVYHGYVSKHDQGVKYKGCIIVLHGVSDNRRDFLANYHFWKNMRNDFLYVVPEFPGFGESKLPFTKAGCYKSFILWMQYVKKYYNVYNFIIIGQSFGSTLGLDFYDYMYTHKKLEDNSANNPTYNPFFNPEHGKSVDIQFDDNEKFKITNLILYSPFTTTYIEVMDYYYVFWARLILRPILNYLITPDVYFNLINEPKDLNDSIITIIYTLNDREVPASNSIRLKNVLKNAQYVEYADHNHINLFIDHQIWDDNYNEINHGKRDISVNIKEISEINKMLRL
jgi:hypothetical protein